MINISVFFAKFGLICTMISAMMAILSCIIACFYEVNKKDKIIINVFFIYSFILLLCVTRLNQNLKIDEYLANNIIFHLKLLLCILLITPVSFWFRDFFKRNKPKQ